MNWNKNLCHNSDFETTCLSLWTPCLAFGFNKQKYETLDGQVATHWCGPALAYVGSNIVGSFLMFNYGICFLDVYNITLSKDAIQALSAIGGTISTSCYAGYFRKQLREKYSITGSLTNDICTHIWCSPCALCQESAELKYQNDIMNNDRDFTKAPYVQLMSDS